MFSAFFSRLRRSGEAKPPPAAPVRAAPAPRPVVARSPAVAPAGVGARRPLVSARGGLAGFEFHAAAMDPRRLRRSEDGAVAAAYAGNVLGAMRLCTAQGLAALAEFPAAWLARCEHDELFTPGMHLRLRTDASTLEPRAWLALCARLRALGVRVGWDPDIGGVTEATDACLPDFIPLAAPAVGDASAWLEAIAASARRWPGLPLVLLDLPTVEVLETVLGPNVLLAGCRVEVSTVSPRVQALPPQGERLLRLLHRLLHDDDNTGVVDAIKADAALCLRLLHYLNSAGASPGRELDSIEQAVLVLGRDALYRWIAQMLVRMAPPRPAADALQSLALARARMLELLARAEDAHNPGSLYLLGLASMLPLLLQCSLAVAGEALCLSPVAMQALQEHAGPLAPHLSLLEALEANDLPGAETLAARFGGLGAVLACWTEAWRQH